MKVVTGRLLKENDRLARKLKGTRDDYRVLVRQYGEGVGKVLDMVDGAMKSSGLKPIVVDRSLHSFSYAVPDDLPAIYPNDDLSRPMEIKTETGAWREYCMRCRVFVPANHSFTGPSEGSPAVMGALVAHGAKLFAESIQKEARRVVTGRAVSP